MCHVINLIEQSDQFETFVKHIQINNNNNNNNNNNSYNIKTRINKKLVQHKIKLDSVPNDIIQLMLSFEISIRICQPENGEHYFPDDLS